MENNSFIQVLNILWIWSLVCDFAPEISPPEKLIQRERRLQWTVTASDRFTHLQTEKQENYTREINKRIKWEVFISIWKPPEDSELNWNMNSLFFRPCSPHPRELSLNVSTNKSVVVYAEMKPQIESSHSRNLINKPGELRPTKWIQFVHFVLLRPGWPTWW